MTYSKVGLDSLHTGMAPDILNNSSSLLRKIPGVAAVLLSKRKDGLNGFLVYFKSNHN